MAQKNYLAVVRPAETDLDPVESLLLADLQEGGHTIENDLAEIVRGGKTDYSPNAMSESFKLTIGNVPGDKGIEAVKHAVQTGGQLRIWLYERNKRADGKHHGMFGYVVPESFEMSFDDESDKIELSLKVKWNTAEVLKITCRKSGLKLQVRLQLNTKNSAKKSEHSRIKRKLVLYLIQTRKTILCKLIDQGGVSSLFFYKKIEKRYIF